MSIWVIDYKLYEPALTALKFPDPASTGCNQLSLSVEGQIPASFTKHLINNNTHRQGV